jgi:hypothetical protein
MSTNISAASKVSNLYSALVIGDLNLIKNEVDQLISENGTEVLVMVNAFLAQPAHLTLLVRHILHQEAALTQVVNDSYYHENGFHKIVLLSGRCFKLRLHHFGAGVKLPMENVHDHRWPFASSILAGSMKMDLFQVSETEGEPVVHYCYHSDKSKGSYETARIGEKFVKRTRRKVYKAGQQYLMLPEDLHRIVNKRGEESITLILTGNPVGQTCNLYARRDILDEEKTPVPYQQLQMNRMLGDIVEKIFPSKN